MKVFGHEDIIESLGHYVPPVVAFVGPSSVGKWTTAEWVRETHNISAMDILRVHRLSRTTARDVIEFMRLPAWEPTGRLAIVQVDSSYESVLGQDVLLKTLEENLVHRLILISTQPLLPVVRTRMHKIFQFRLLTEEQVTQVLVEKKSFSTSIAANLARLSGGQVQRALDALGYKELRGTVIAALNAVRVRDTKAIDSLATKWTDPMTELLTIWCYETMTSNWRVFREEDSKGLGHVASLLLTELRPNVRPRFVVRSALMAARSIA